MKVGISTHIQFSLFSSGAGGTSLAIAEAFRNMGNEVWLVNTHSESQWWEDCPSLKQIWENFLCRASDVARGELPGDKKPFDLFLEVERPCFSSAEERLRAATSCVWVVRKSPILHDIEATLFPFETQKRSLDGIKAAWCFDLNTSEDDLKYLECLVRVPAMAVPFTWTPSFIEIYRAETRSKEWSAVTASREADIPWSIHICETNNSAASSLTIPLTVLRHIKKRGGFAVTNYFLHNAEHVQRSQFFKQNVWAHCQHPDLSGQFVGRQRVVDWVNDPKSCVLSHMRFMSIRPYLLDAAWVGIPVVHNSLGLKEVEGYDRYYYPDNQITSAEKALVQMNADFQEKTGIFAPEALTKIRNTILTKFSSYSVDICNRWAAAVSTLNNIPLPKPVEVVKLPQVESAPAVREVRVLFTDMWDDFNAEYNMFILMMNEAGRHLTPPVKAVGVSFAMSGPERPDLVIFGPFGEEWKRITPEIPKVHYTGENSSLIGGEGVKMNIGYQHADFKDQEYLRIPLWMFEIDWFGADKERLVNPKPLPIDRCCKVSPEDLSMKQKFCAFVVTNPCNPVRNNSFHWLSQYKQVDSAGRLFNNIGDAIFAGRGGGGGELKKFEFLRNYKFCLAYENSSSQGYTTEKFLHAKAAGCIPIYWGDPKVERDFDAAGFIDAREFTRPEQLIEAVRKVDEDPSLWLKMYSVPALDDTRRDLVRRTLSECAHRLLRISLKSEEGLEKIPRFLGATSDKEAAGLSKIRDTVFAATTGATATATASETKEMTLTPNEKSKSVNIVTSAKQKQPIPEIIAVTGATRRFLPSLHQWLVSIQAQKRDPNIQVGSDVWLGHDIEVETENELSQEFPWVHFHRYPTDLQVEGFPDLWDPQHFSWKLWILREITSNQEYAGKVILYMDSGIFMCRWPSDWIYIAKENGLCVLEDPRETNERWCHEEFCKQLAVNDDEKSQQQIWAGAIAFEAGHSLSRQVFDDAWKWAQKRSVIVGPKWEGVRNGKPFGHRHDQSILSILTSRAEVPRYPMDLLYCSESLRRTFMTKKALYVHRGGFAVHKQFSEKIDDCYVINLDRRADRMEKLYKNSPELEGRLQRVTAYEGKNLQLTPAIARLFRPHDFNWKKPVMGCALSHLSLWWQLANEKEDINSYLILEDDVKFLPNWEARWKEAAPHLPEGWDVIYLGGILPPNRAAFEGAKERVNGHFSRVAENTVFFQNPPNRYFHWCAYSYVLSKQGAQKILEILKARDGYWTSADHMICNPIGILHMYFLDPLVAGCYQDDDPKYQTAAFNDFTRVDGFDSDLWNNNECFPKDDSDALAHMDIPLDIQAALADARQILPVVQVAKQVDTNVSETMLGGESPESAKESLKQVLKNTVDPAWNTLYQLVEANDIYAARAHIFRMIEEWKADWDKRPTEDFDQIVKVLGTKNISDLPSKDRLTEIRNKFAFLTDASSEQENEKGKEKIKKITTALYDLSNFGHKNAEVPSLSKRRLLGLRNTDLKAEKMFEVNWLQELFGKEFSLEIHEIGPEDEPPTDKPILVVMRPHLPIWTEMLRKWSEKGAQYFILHLSDEHASDPLALYQSPDCLGIVRTYSRAGLEPFNEKLVVIPLGYHWTKNGGMDDPEARTPRLPFREYIWSFYGTDWNGRSENMKNLQLLQPHKLQWFREWNDAAMIGKDAYLDILLNSRFVPVPGGQNPETYRFYEALECGCIPVYVRQANDDEFINTIRKFLPLPDLQNWDQATAFIYELSNNQGVMEGFRHACLEGWKKWKNSVKNDLRKNFQL